MMYQHNKLVIGGPVVKCTIKFAALPSMPHKVTSYKLADKKGSRTWAPGVLANAVRKTKIGAEGLDPSRSTN